MVANPEMQIAGPGMQTRISPSSFSLHRQMAMILRSDFPLAHGFHYLAAAMASPRVRTLLFRVATSLAEGDTPAVALAHAKSLLPSPVRAALVANPDPKTIATLLDLHSEHISQRMSDLWNWGRRGIYLTTILMVMGTLVPLLSIKVLPAIQAMCTDTLPGLELPFATSTLIASRPLWWLIWPGVVLAVLYAAGAMAAHTGLTGTPGRLFPSTRLYETARVVKLVARCLKQGIEPVRALNIAAASSSRGMRKELEALSDSINRGDQAGPSGSAGGSLPAPVKWQLLRPAPANEIATALTRMGVLCQSEAEAANARHAEWMEVIGLITCGLLILWVAAGTLLPLFQLPLNVLMRGME